MFETSIPIETIREVLTAEVTATGGAISEAFEDGTRLLARSIFPSVREVQPGDLIQGGVALRAAAGEIWVHPYVFRQVCTNGAIRAHALETRHIRPVTFATQAEALVSLRTAIRQCAGAEAFAAGAGEMQAACHTEEDFALTMMPLLSRLSPAEGARVLTSIFELFFGDADPSRFGLMNAVTAVARDTPDPELRWRLEEFGGGIAVGGCPPPVSGVGKARPTEGRPLQLA